MISNIVQLANTFRWHDRQVFASDITTPVITCVVYIVTVFSLKSYFKNRPAWNVNNAVAIHNLFLCLLSLTMLIGTLNEVVPGLINNGIFDTFCDHKRKYITGRLMFWCYIFYLSKFYELLDTFFIVVKKRPLVFLHYFHHIATLLTCYAGLEANQTSQWIALFNNTLVHTFMYYYYFVSARGGKVWWKKYLTMAQIVQFWINIGGLLLWLYFDYITPGGCAGEVWAFCVCMSLSILLYVLFQQFYSKTYKNADDDKKRKAK